jgi:hypothetical protein
MVTNKLSLSTPVVVSYIDKMATEQIAEKPITTTLKIGSKTK